MLVHPQRSTGAEPVPTLAQPSDPAQAMPQPPQSVRVPMDVSHPSEALALQSAWVVSQVKTHVPATQATVPLTPVGHTFPQPPQCRMSVVTSTHEPPQ